MKFYLVALVALLGSTDAKHAKHHQKHHEHHTVHEHHPTHHTNKLVQSHRSMEGRFMTFSEMRAHHKVHHLLPQRPLTLADLEKDCDSGLEISVEEMNYQMEMFSRTFNLKHYNNSMVIFGKLQAKGVNVKEPQVTTWEMYDRAFAWPRVRRYDIVEQEMDTLEHFQDNLNMNISNGRHVEQFLKHGRAVHDIFRGRYKNGEFDDPANTDPKKEK